MPSKNGKGTSRYYASQKSAMRAAEQRKIKRVLKKRESVAYGMQIAPQASPYSGRLLQNMPVTGFPNELSVRLRYSLFRSYTTGVAGLAGQDIYQFKINSVYDPDLTSTGHQPMYRDQLYLIYKYCVVTATKWTLMITTQATVGQVVNVQASTYATTDTDTSANIERGQTHQCMVQLGSPATLTGNVSMPVLFGLRSVEALLSDDLYRHDSSNDPSQLAYLSVYSQDISLNTSVLQMNLTLDYSCVFKETLRISQS